MLPAKEHDKSITSMSFGNPDTLSPAKFAEDERFTGEFERKHPESVNIIKPIGATEGVLLH